MRVPPFCSILMGNFLNELTVRGAAARNGGGGALLSTSTAADAVLMHQVPLMTLAACGQQVSVWG